MTSDDIIAARFAYMYRNEAEAALHAPDAETSKWARGQYRKGVKILERYTVWTSSHFPMGADPDGKRLDEFVASRKIVYWIEIDAGYVGTMQQRCYIGLAERVG